MTRRRHITLPGNTWHHLASLWVTQYILTHPYTSLYKHPLAGVAMAAAAGRRSGATSCNAAAVKKKGVKVVHGKEIPWNLFSPKAPYQGKVVENDFHPQTLTEPTGDANWETTHVTFDHGGKAGCRMNQEDAACESLLREFLRNLSRVLQCHAMQCYSMSCKSRLFNDFDCQKLFQQQARNLFGEYCGKQVPYIEGQSIGVIAPGPDTWQQPVERNHLHVFYCFLRWEHLEFSHWSRFDDLMFAGMLLICS